MPYSRLEKKCCKFPAALLGLLLFVAFLNLTEPGAVFAGQSDTVEITGEGVTTPVTLTLDQLQAMEQYQHVYSAINTWPTKKWYIARGVKLRDLFALAGIKEDATLVRFLSKDGFEVTLTVKELLQDKRYYYPFLMENHPSDGSIPGSTEKAVEVEPVLALLSAEDSNKPADMNDRDALLLVLGQRAVSEQTNGLFLKYVNKIEVLTTPPQKWDNPRADLESGEVPAGSQVRLSNKRNDVDKVYYTTDGSTPDLNSPMFNISSSRWWALRPDLDLVNQPIKIDEDTVIKAITIGPGKLDSDVVTFTYKADYSGRAAERAKLPAGPPTQLTLDQDKAELKIGSSIELTASVGPGNAGESVVWSSSDTSVATVDHNGLVTLIGPGAAVITAKTANGSLTATCVVQSPDQDSGEQDAEPAVVQQDLALEEYQVVPPAVEPVEQPPMEEKNTGTESSGEEPVEPVETVEVETVEPEEPIENGQYLVEKEALAAAADADAAGEQAENPVQIFEVSVEAGPLQLPVEQNSMDFYTAGFFVFLFLFGASRRYMEYVREVKR
jgi:hypothetical protein